MWRGFPATIGGCFQSGFPSRSWRGVPARSGVCEVVPVSTAPLLADFLITPTGKDPFRFSGGMLAECSSSPPADMPKREKNPAAKRRFTLRAFQTNSNPAKFVGTIEFQSDFANEPPKLFAEVAPDPALLVAWFRAFDPCHVSIWNWRPWNAHGAEDRVRQVRESIAAWYGYAVDALAAKVQPPRELT